MSYHHGNLREALIDAGVAVAAAEGPDAIGLREISRGLGVSHNAAYRHFADRDELMRAVSARAMTQFGQLVADRIAAAASGPGIDRAGIGGTSIESASIEAAMDRLEACGRAYVEFAVTQPGLFRVALLWSLGTIEPDAEVAHPYTQLSERIDELVAVGAITSTSRENLEIAAWSAVHGFAMLVLDGPLRELPPDQRDLGLARLLAVFRAGI